MKDLIDFSGCAGPEGCDKCPDVNSDKCPLKQAAKKVVDSLYPNKMQRKTYLEAKEEMLMDMLLFDTDEENCPHC